MFFYLVQVSLLPISSTAIELSSGDFVETSNQTATQRPEVSSENAPVEVVEEKEKDEGEAQDKSKEVFHNGLFSCPSEGCVFEFQKYSNLEYYIIYGKYRIEEEETTLVDKAKLLYVQKLTEGTSTQPQMASSTVLISSSKKRSEGWALRASKNQRITTKTKRIISMKSSNLVRRLVTKKIHPKLRVICVVLKMKTESVDLLLASFYHHSR